MMKMISLLFLWTRGGIRPPFPCVSYEATRSSYICSIFYSKASFPTQNHIARMQQELVEAESLKADKEEAKAKAEAPEAEALEKHRFEFMNNS